jgi:predicted metalloprotease with PDZ domain
MIKKYSSVLVLMLIVLSLSAQKGKDFKGYRFTIDLTRVTNDQIRVDLKTPAITAKTITYQLPKIVPGTYSIDDYGRYVEQFKAFNIKGDTLKVVRKDENSWTISGSEKMVKLSYLVNDSYDDFTTKQVIFEPAGSDIVKDTVYAINNHCFLGYFDDMKNIPYELTVVHLPKMYGSTAMIDLDKNASVDKFITSSYNQIVDNPILYDVPDTTFIKVGNSSVLISVYSPNKLLSSGFLAKKLETLLIAQTKYLGGKLPVEKYAYIIFLDDKPGPSGHVGALEHSYSSFYYLGETDSLRLSQFFLDAAAHEFFHIITPLSIHSDKIQYFDFNNPDMSEHLWLYEGSTEYHAHMVQEKYGLITPQQLLNTLSNKITDSKTRYLDTLPFTDMSKGALDQYKEQYENVYQKGALIAFCMDVELLKLSNGKYGFVNLMNDLSATYGKQKGFKDEELFDQIGKLTYPEIETFLKTYVSGNQPLPLTQVFTSLGINFQPLVETKDSSFSIGLGFSGFGLNRENNSLYIRDSSSINSFGKLLGYQQGDEFVSINGMDLNYSNAGNYFRNFQASAKAGEEFVVKVRRKDANGAIQVVELKAVMEKYPKIKRNALEFSETATPEQLKLREYWLKPNGIQAI